ncbi:HDOD domain-containing protein [Psychrobium sp. MM17-31]|uniref:HDOD domain-containing protein n=1 Tax=Psychrobium sp. MM17-31 TaxID=2917758 RepID=UPI001EF4BBD7|nr:HDOD domain-containing protein [Psychrobium sp. MM17-31]MCG7530263.1 HDOD domain-containing protein [Psychrobium sp. MM17-31]
MLELSEFVTKANKLYTLPDICLQLNSLVNSKNSSVDDIACLVSHDPALTFRVLKLANSALYSRKGNISTIDEAIQKIGTDELCNIAIATSAALVFKGAGRNKINLKDYWQHSVFTAIIARELYQLKSQRKEGAMFVAGLLHNIGFLIVLERLPYYMVKLADVVGEEHKERGFEKETLGFTFVDISSELLKKWQLGDDLIDLVTNQFSAHSSENNQLKCSCLNAAIDISDQIFETSQIKSMSLIQHISDDYQLDLDADALSAVIDRSVENVHNIVKIIQG